jgi:hypothetical protein
MTFYQIIMHSQMQVLLSMLEFWYLILSVVLSKIKLNNIKGSVAGFGKCKICKLFTPLTDYMCVAFRIQIIPHKPCSSLTAISDTSCNALPDLITFARVNV